MRMRPTTYWVVASGAAISALFLGGGCAFPPPGATLLSFAPNEDVFCFCEPTPAGDTYQVVCYDTNYILTYFTAHQVLPGLEFADPDCTFSIDQDGDPGPNSNKTATAYPPASPASAEARTSSPRAAATFGSSPTSGLAPFTRALPLVPGLTPAEAANLQPQCDPASSFYKTNHSSASVSHISICPPTLIASIPVTTNPLQLAVTPDNKTLLVTSYDNAITFIDTATDKVTFTLNTPNLYPSGIAISPDGSTAYVTNYFDIGTSLMVVDIASRSIVAQIPMPFYYPKHVYLTPDGSQAWINFDLGNEVVIVDTLTKTVAAALNMSAIAYTGMAFNPTGTLAYIALYNGTVAVVDTATHSIVTTVPVGPWPVDVAFNRDGTMIIVDSYDQQGIITAVDPRTNQALGTLMAGAPATCLAILPTLAN